MGFFGKPSVGAEAYEKLLNRMTELEVKYYKLESKFVSLRGLIHRKNVGDMDFRDEKEVGHIDDGFDELRKLNKEHPS